MTGLGRDNRQSVTMCSSARVRQSSAGFASVTGWSSVQAPLSPKTSQMIRWRLDRRRASSRVATVTHSTDGNPRLLLWRSATQAAAASNCSLGLQMGQRRKPTGSINCGARLARWGVQGVYLARRARSSDPRVQERAALKVCITDGSQCDPLTGSTSPSRLFVQNASKAPNPLELTG